MKKIAILLLTMAVVFSAVFVFSACGDGNDPKNYVYESVDIDAPEKREDLANILSEKLLANAPDVNDEQAVEQWLSQLTFAITGKSSFEADLNFEGNVSAQFGCNVQLTENMLVALGYSQQQGLQFAANVGVGVSGGVTLPLDLLADEGLLSADLAEKLQNALEDFDVGLNLSLDNENAYVDLDDGAQQFVSDLGVTLPTEKFQLSLEGLSDGIDFDIDFNSGETQPDIQAQLALNIADILRWLREYDVDVDVSTQNGWTLRLTFTEQTFRSLFADKSGMTSQLADWVSSVAAFDKLQTELFISFDADNELTVTLSTAVECSFGAEQSLTLPLGFSGSFKLADEQTWRLSKDKVQLPADTEQYYPLQIPDYSPLAIL